MTAFPTGSPEKPLRKVLSSLRLLSLDRWNYIIPVCFALIFLFASRLNVDYDLGYHLKTGEWILQHHAFPDKDKFTYTVPQNDYIDSHWLYQVILFLLFRIGGYAGLSFLNVLLILAVFALIFTRMRKTGCPAWLLFLLFFPAILAMEIRFLIRPEVLSWLFLSLDLIALDLWAEKRKNFLFILPLVQLIWTNSEGLFVLGWVVMGAYFISLYLQTRRVDLPLLKAFLLSLALSFLNPYFLKGVAFPLELFTRFDPSNLFKRYISELQSPWSILRDTHVPFFPATPIYAYRILAPLVLLLILSGSSRRKFHGVFLSIAFFLLSAAAIRNMPLFFLAALPLAASSLKDFASAPGGWLKRLDGFFRSRKFLPFGTAFLVLLLCLRVGSQAYYVSERRAVHNGWGIDSERIPVKAAAFLEKNGLQGLILNELGFGGWLEWRGGLPVFIDGRLEVMGEGLFAEYRDSFNPGGLWRLVKQYGIQLVLYNHMAGISWTTQLQQMSGWRLIYYDDLAAIWAAPGYAAQFETVASRNSLAAWDLVPPPSDNLLLDFQKKRRNVLADWAEGFVFPQTYPMPLMRLGTFAYENEDYETAKDLFLGMLEKTQGRYYEVYFNLGAAYVRLGRPDLAEICYKKVLELEPDNPAALEKLKQL